MDPKQRKNRAQFGSPSAAVQQGGAVRSRHLKVLKLPKTVLVTQSDPRHVTRPVSSAVPVLLLKVLVLCRLKRPGPRRKYGLLSDYDDSVEMVEGESEEDDTLYEARSLRRSEVTLPVRPLGL